MKKLSILSSLLLIFASCEKEQKEDVVQDINKDGSIETIVSVEHKENFDLLITTHKIWIKNQLEKTIIKTDTLKSLGKSMQEGEDENGNTQNLEVPKDYEFYITVK